MRGRTYRVPSSLQVRDLVELLFTISCLRKETLLLVVKRISKKIRIGRITKSSLRYFVVGLLLVLGSFTSNPFIGSSFLTRLFKVRSLLTLDNFQRYQPSSSLDILQNDDILSSNSCFFPVVLVCASLLFQNGACHDHATLRCR